jgi:HNH endonuclease/AP2 domain
MKPMPSQEEVNKLLRYEPDTGKFFWRVDIGRWGRIKAGSRADSDRGDRYRRVHIGRRHYLGHRLAWLLARGTLPKGEIDHINGDPADNRLSNLRLATHAQNLMNSGKRINNTSGFKGVSRDHSTRFRATIWLGGKQRYLGSFVTREEAYTAYCKAAQELHGEFARLA